jgi:DNA-binding phage protein
MRKKKISKQQGFSLSDIDPIRLKSRKGLSTVKASGRLRNKQLIAQALWECLVDNDIDAFKDILRTHLEVVNKQELSKAAGIPRRTLFRMLSTNGNPTLETVGKIIHKLCA